ncbi:hypothetical protein [Natronorarus salvus]|uniref:hypothetical protein n=1 Tax=Natronorarus salvus TaxID=3117733 RepID=UPI002F266EC2
MSDTDGSPTEIKEDGDTSDTGSLRERMASFRDEHVSSRPIESLRDEAAQGISLSETVIEGRNERVK